MKQVRTSAAIRRAPLQAAYGLARCAQAGISILLEETSEGSAEDSIHYLKDAAGYDK